MRAPAGSCPAIHATCCSITARLRLAQSCSCDRWFSSMRWLKAGSSQGILRSWDDNAICLEPVIIVPIVIIISLLITRASARVSLTPGRTVSGPFVPAAETKSAAASSRLYAPRESDKAPDSLYPPRMAQTRAWGSKRRGPEQIPSGFPLLSTAQCRAG